MNLSNLCAAALVWSALACAPSSVLAAAANTPTGTIAITVSSNQLISAQCQGGLWTVQPNFSLKVSVNGLAPNQPMQETGLPTIDSAWFLNGAPATVVAKQVNGAKEINTNANIWSFMLQDDGPNVGGQLTLGACTQGATAPTVTVGFTSSSFVVGTGFNNIPPVSAVPTILNALLPANIASGSVVVPSPSVSASPSPGSNKPNPNIVVTFAADPGQNGGQGINNIQCQSNGQLTTTVNLLASVDLENIHAYQPMAELGLPVINMAFFINGKPGAVTTQNTFNVASSAVSGNVWSFGLADDGPHPGAQMTIGTCTPGGTLPAVTVSFNTTTFIVGQGLPNGADGGPPVPALSGIPTVVNALSPQFVAGAVTASASATPTPTVAVKVSASATPSPVVANVSPSATPTPAVALKASPSPSTAAVVAGACIITYPNTQDPILSAAGLATPWEVSGGCDQTTATVSFIQGSVFDPETGNIFVYNPLLINAGTQPAIKPVVPTIPAGAVIVIHFGSNANSVTLADKSGGAMLTAANCVNGGGPDNSIFGQYAYCNGVDFYASVNANLGILNPPIPALGTDKVGQACITTRHFALVDQDPSDNVDTSYLLTSDNTLAQNTAANQAALTAAGKTFKELDNGSDNRLLSVMNKIIGCTTYMAPDLANNNAMTPALALDEIMAANRQGFPVAKVPMADPMVLLANGNIDTTGAKLAAYRKGVNQNFANPSTLGNTKVWCTNYAAIAPQYFVNWANAGLTSNAAPADPAVGTTMASFLGARFQASWANLKCQELTGLPSPVTCLDAMGNSSLTSGNPAKTCSVTTTFNIQSVEDAAGDNLPDSATTANAKSEASFIQSSVVTVLAASLVGYLACRS